nr:MAG TPA: hypothetical protein [Bacteriophage sp.]
MPQTHLIALILSIAIFIEMVYSYGYNLIRLYLVLSIQLLEVNRIL